MIAYKIAQNLFNHDFWLDVSLKLRSSLKPINSLTMKLTPYITLSQCDILISYFII